MIVTVKHLKPTEKWDLPSSDEDIKQFIDGINHNSSFEIAFDAITSGEDIEILNKMKEYGTAENWETSSAPYIRLSKFTKSLITKNETIRGLEYGDLIIFNNKTYLYISKDFVYLDNKERPEYIKRVVGDLYQNHIKITSGDYYGELVSDDNEYDETKSYKRIFKVVEVVEDKVFTDSYIIGNKEPEKLYDYRTLFKLEDFIDKFGEEKIEVLSDAKGEYITKLTEYNGNLLTQKVRFSLLSKSFD